MPHLPRVGWLAGIVGAIAAAGVLIVDRTTVTVTLPRAQLEPAVLNPSQSYVYAEQQGLFNRIGNFFSGNPNSQQQVYISAQQKIQTAARQSPLLSLAQKNTQAMLTSLGFTHVTVTFGGAPAS